jgi:hypothetical protein
MNFDLQKVVMHIPKAFYLNLRFPKDYHQEKVHYTLSYLLYVIICLLKVVHFYFANTQTNLVGTGY